MQIYYSICILDFKYLHTPNIKSSSVGRKHCMKHEEDMLFASGIHNDVSWKGEGQAPSLLWMPCYTTLHVGI